MNSVTQRQDEKSETKRDVDRNIIPMDIDGTIYLVGFGFSRNPTRTLSDSLRALICKDFRAAENKA